MIQESPNKANNELAQNARTVAATADSSCLASLARRNDKLCFRCAALAGVDTKDSWRISLFSVHAVPEVHSMWPRQRIPPVSLRSRVGMTRSVFVAPL